jgi:hypothetical protein
MGLTIQDGLGCPVHSRPGPLFPLLDCIVVMVGLPMVPLHCDRIIVRVISVGSYCCILAHLACPELIWNV